MTKDFLYNKSLLYLKTLCVDITERCVGSEGNRKATRFFEKELSSIGWNAEAKEFQAIDWEENGAVLQCADKCYNALVSPYSLGCDVSAILTGAAAIEELERSDPKDKILLIYGNLAKEQLMPKNFVFYNPLEHQKIISLLEKKNPAAIISATGRCGSLAGGVYPFPLIEDGDFDIPSVYLTEEEGNKLLECIGQKIMLKSISRRIPGKGENIIAGKGNSPAGQRVGVTQCITDPSRIINTKRIVVEAHIDAKKGSPGAIDNATGIVSLLLLAHLLKDYNGNKTIELAALNGEDYYAASGQMLYLKENQDCFKDMLLDISIDGAGYLKDKTYFSLFELPPAIAGTVKEVIKSYQGIAEGPLYFQGDHSMFLQNGCPAIAVSSKWLIDNHEDQQITHTARDTIDIVDCNRLIELTEAIYQIIRML